MGGPDTGPTEPPRPREPFQRNTVYHQGQLKERAGFLESRSLPLSSTPVGRRRHSMIFNADPKKSMKFKTNKRYIVVSSAFIEVESFLQKQ